MKTITDGQVCYKMSPNNIPCARIAPNESICFATRDCYSNNIQSPSDRFTTEMWDTVNPATGPVYVQGALPGHIMRIDIEDIQIRDHAVMCIEHGSGALAEHIEGAETTILQIEQGRLVFNDNLSIPVKPMIGVIGLAPGKEDIPNGTPGEHGGNMDCKEITKGSSIYLPIEVEGGLLALGDLHAVMGDGEVCICGAEVSGQVVLKTSIVSPGMPTPCVETDQHLIIIASALTLDECEKIVLDKTHKFLVDALKLQSNDAVRLMSLVGELRVAQVVDPLKTMKFLLPKNMLS